MQDVAQFGRALGLGPRGCEFKSHHSDLITYHYQSISDMDYINMPA